MPELPIFEDDKTLTPDEEKLVYNFVEGNPEHPDWGGCYKQVTLQALQTEHIVIIDIREAMGDGYIAPEVKELMFEKPQAWLKSLTYYIENILNRTILDMPQNAHNFASVHLKNICSSGNKVDRLKIKKLYDPKNWGRLKTTEGIIKSMTSNDARVLSSKWECANCGRVVEINQTSNETTEPRFCICSEKTKAHFKKLDETTSPFVIMEIEELPENDDDKNSVITLICDGNLCRVVNGEVAPSRFIPNPVSLGQRVSITAFVDATPEWLLSKEEAQKPTKKSVLLANYIEQLEEEIINTTITNEDEQKIRSLAADPNIFSILTESVAPQLEGLTNVKEAILFALFGGVRRVGKVNARGIINLLLVSDPSKGKSSLFEYIKKIAPKCKKVLGGTTTKAGLGAGATRSEITGKFTIEAGALVMANKGVLLIDELDKMTPEDMASLHESMESCSITKSIVGQNRSFNAETCIIGACNPKSGRFDGYESVTQQIKLPPAIISRFDAIFAMRDIPNAAEDTAILTRIYKNYAQPENINPLVPPELLRKYIILAKRITPKFTHSEEIQDVLTQFYVGMRTTSVMNNGHNTIPITTRQAESILRFAEASARIRLSEQVEKDDIQRAIQIILGYLKEFGFDPSTGRYDIDRVVSDMSSTGRNTARAILAVLADRQVQSYELVLQRVKEQIPTLNEIDFEDMMSRLSRKGELTEPRRGHYQLT
jgi:replicative DNA helicase Mcm